MVRQGQDVLPPSAAAPTAGGPSAQEGLPVRPRARGAHESLERGWGAAPSFPTHGPRLSVETPDHTACPAWAASPARPPPSTRHMVPGQCPSSMGAGALPSLPGGAKCPWLPGMGGAGLCWAEWQEPGVLVRQVERRHLLKFRRLRSKPSTSECERMWGEWA